MSWDMDADVDIKDRAPDKTLQPTAAALGILIVTNIITSSASATVVY
jgi:hypothetical protein